MAKFQNKPGSGVFFVNDRKTGEKQPDYKGEIISDRQYMPGDVIKIAGWKKPTPRNHLIAISVDTRAEAFPKPVGRDDNDVPF